MVKEVSQSEMVELVKSGAYLVDVREVAERQEGTIPGSKHVPFSELADLRKGSNIKSPLIFYCSSGLRSMKAAEIVEDWMEGPVYFLQGGYSSIQSEVC